MNKRQLHVHPAARRRKLARVVVAAPGALLELLLQRVLHCKNVTLTTWQRKLPSAFSPAQWPRELWYRFLLLLPAEGEAAAAALELRFAAFLPEGAMCIMGWL